MIDLLKQIENDKIKQNKCTENNIYLITVPYYITNKEKFIKDEINNCEFLRSYNYEIS